MKHRRDHVLKVMVESITKNLAPAPHVAMAEAEYMAEFIEHTKKVCAHLALTQCNSEVQPDELLVLQRGVQLHMKLRPLAQ